MVPRKVKYTAVVWMCCHCTCAVKMLVTDVKYKPQNMAIISELFISLCKDST